ncbi:hypothetical protein FRB93_005128 [Tulasnella sp. JGI-2019a]|nr:hypothetical protein FRB93_005128 [Tulasnella sp. JGI-2019a]
MIAFGDVLLAALFLAAIYNMSLESEWFTKLFNHICGCILMAVMYIVFLLCTQPRFAISTFNDLGYDTTPDTPSRTNTFDDEPAPCPPQANTTFEHAPPVRAHVPSSMNRTPDYDRPSTFTSSRPSVSDGMDRQLNYNEPPAIHRPIASTYYSSRLVPDSRPAYVPRTNSLYMSNNISRAVHSEYRNPTPSPLPIFYPISAPSFNYSAPSPQPPVLPPSFNYSVPPPQPPVLPPSFNYSVPPPQPPVLPPSLDDLFRAALTHLRSANIFYLATDANCGYLPCDLELANDFWNVKEMATGRSVGIIDRASHFGQGILTLAKIHNQTTDKMPSDPVLMVLRSHFFESLPRNPVGRYPTLTPPSQSTYIGLRDPDNSYSSVIEWNSRLYKALELIALGDFITSADSLAVDPSPVPQMPVATIPVNTGLPAVEASTEAVSVNIASSVGPLLEPMVTDDTPVGPLLEPMVTADTPVGPLLEPMVTADTPVGPLLEPMVTDDTPVGPLLEPMVTDDTPVGPLLEPMVTADTPVGPLLEPMVTDDTPVGPLLEPMVTADTPVGPLLEPMVTDDTPVDEIAAEPVSTPVPASPVRSTVIPTFTPPVTSFPYFPLHERDVKRFGHPGSLVKGDTLFEGACAVSSMGPSGHVDSGLLHLSMLRFLDRDTSKILNEPVLTFTQDGTPIGYFTVVESYPVGRNDDNSPRFQYVLQPVGQENRTTVVITMSEEDAQELCRVTGCTLPDPVPVKILESAPSLIPVPSPPLPPASSAKSSAIPFLPPPAPTRATGPSPSASSASPATGPTPQGPVPQHIYTTSCFFINRQSRIRRSPGVLSYRYMQATSGMEWEYTHEARAAGKKRTFISIDTGKSEWTQEGDSRLITLVGIDKYRIGNDIKLTIEMTEAVGAKFCEWIGIPNGSMQREVVQPVASTSTHFVPTSNVGEVDTGATQSSSAPLEPTPTFDFGAPTTPQPSSVTSAPTSVFVFGPPAADVTARAIKPLSKAALSRMFKMKF